MKRLHEVYLFCALCVCSVRGFSIGSSSKVEVAPTVSFRESIAIDRRSAMQSIAAASALLVGIGPSPALASYIDPLTDPPAVTKRVYLDVQIADKPPERITISLFGELMPKTVENFVKLCENNGYAGTNFYRVLSDFNIQGGAIGDPTGKTGQSAFGAPFEPDNFNLRHTKAGLVSTVRGVGGGVDSRFFINCSDDAGWADDRYAAFGIVDEDSMKAIKKIEKVDVKRPSNTPTKEVKIIASGVL